jgi:hypothetical protein
MAATKLDIRTVEIRLVGDSPLICHAWSDKAKKLMLDKQMKKAKSGKEAKDPWRDFCDSMYWLTERPESPDADDITTARFGFPVVAFKAAAVGACRFVDGVKMTEARGAFHIIGEMTEIEGTPEIREDMVRVGMGTADIRYRGEFKEWATTLTVRYNGTALSTEQIVNLFNTAGFGVGVGEWRPEKNGSYGMFHVSRGDAA